MVSPALVLGIVLAPWFGFSSDLWPGEGIPTIKPTGADVQLHATPTSASSATLVPVQRGAPLSWDHVVFRTVRPGLVTALSQVSLRVRDLGSMSHLTGDAYYHGGAPPFELTLGPGDALVDLHYRAEGACLVAHGGRVLEVDYCSWLFGDEPPQFRIFFQSSTELWVRVANAQGTPQGWLLAHPSSAVEFGERTF